MITETMLFGSLVLVEFGGVRRKDMAKICNDFGCSPQMAGAQKILKSNLLNVNI